MDNESFNYYWRQTKSGTTSVPDFANNKQIERTIKLQNDEGDSKALIDGKLLLNAYTHGSQVGGSRIVDFPRLGFQIFDVKREVSNDGKKLIFTLEKSPNEQFKAFTNQLGKQSLALKRNLTMTSFLVKASDGKDSDGSFMGYVILNFALQIDSKGASVPFVGVGSGKVLPPGDNYVNDAWKVSGVK
jgi:hypothetical protein